MGRVSSAKLDQKVREAAGSKSWASEADFVDELRARLPDFLAARFLTWRIYSEVGVGRRVADVVIPVARKHRRSVVLPLTGLECVVLASLRRLGATRIDLLERRSGISSGGLRSGELDRLREWGLVHHGRGGRIAFGPVWNAGVEIVAIEAKLERWRQALAQAQTYLRFADYSYVALPSDVATRVVKNDLASLECSPIGLLTLTPSGVEELVAPTRGQEHDWQREYVASRLSLPPAEGSLAIAET